MHIFKVSPIPALLESSNRVLEYFTRRDVLAVDVDLVSSLWQLPEVIKICQHQKNDGSWRYPGQASRMDSPTNYSLLETFRQLGILVGIYGMDRDHPAIQAAAEYVFSCQTEEGDIRGILGNQYMPYYHGMLLEILTKVGYANDKQLIKGLEWLLTVRQDDGGWIIPAQAVPARQKTEAFWHSPPTPPLRSLPSSHIATGMVLRSFAAHPGYRRHPATIQAATLLKQRFFLPDQYYDRKAPEYWLKFQYPFWWPNLLTVLDALGWMGFPADDPDVQSGLQWFIDHQEADGLWPTGYGKGPKVNANRLWVGLAVCRMLKFFR
jgi:hypothetical protein